MTLAPQPPISTYRGDRYRLNFTAGALLAFLNATSDDVPLRELVTSLTEQNTMAGIPGGPAGAQWTPPGKKPAPRSGGKPANDDDDDIPDLDPLTAPADETEGESYPDTLREFCTFYEQKEDRIAAILRMLDYCKLVDFTGLDVSITDLGREICTALTNAEEAERAKDTGRLSPTQAYLVGDHRDTSVTAYVPPIPVVPFSVTEAVRATAANPENVDADTFTHAVTAAVQQPGLIVDTTTGDPSLDSELPVRRNLLRRPTYRQFLWIIFNDRNTYILANLGVTEANTTLVARKAAHADTSPEAIAKDPTLAKLKELRSFVKKVRPFAQTVLGGGPEGNWVGKPLNAKDVHNDVISYIAAGRPGFTRAMETGSSLAWEAFQANTCTVREFEAAREALRDGVGNGLVSRESLPTTASADPVAIAAAAIADADSRKMDLDKAQKYVERVSDRVLEEIGIDIDVRHVMTPSGVPMAVGCQYKHVHINSETGGRTETPCRGHAIGGSGYCERHGGTYLSPEETQSLVRASQQKFFAAASKAAEVMVEIMLNSSNDAVRLRAAEQIANRAGLSESRDLNINVNDDKDGKSAAQSVRDNIMRLAGLSSETQKEIQDKRDNGGVNQHGEILEAQVESETEE